MCIEKFEGAQTNMMVVRGAWWSLTWLDWGLPWRLESTLLGVSGCAMVGGVNMGAMPDPWPLSLWLFPALRVMGEAALFCDVLPYWRLCLGRSWPWTKTFSQNKTLLLYMTDVRHFVSAIGLRLQQKICTWKVGAVAVTVPDHVVQTSLEIVSRKSSERFGFAGSKQTEPKRSRVSCNRWGCRRGAVGLPRLLRAHTGTRSHRTWHWPAGCQSCFGPTPFCLPTPPFRMKNVYHVPFYLHVCNLIFEFHRGSRIRVCLESQRKVWIWNFEGCQNFWNFGKRIRVVWVVHKIALYQV